MLIPLSRKLGRPVDQVSTVLDLTGLGERYAGKEEALSSYLSYTRRVSEIFEDNSKHSGVAGGPLLVVNAPREFSKEWRILEGEHKRGRMGSFFAMTWAHPGPMSSPDGGGGGCCCC